MITAKPGKIVGLLLLILVPVLAFWQVSFFDYTMKWDIMVQFFPCRFLMSEAFKEHTLPLWCPYINFGYPAYADPQGGFFYPVTWFLASVFGYNSYTIVAEFVLHILIAAAAFYALLRSFKLSHTVAVIIGITYSLSGVFVSNATHLTWVISLAWLPAVISCYRRLLNQPGLLSALLMALVTYLFVVGGYPAFFIIVAYFFIAYSIYHLAVLFSRGSYTDSGKLMLWAACALGILLVLCSGYIYAVWQTLPLIDRGEGLTVHRANAMPLSPKSMLSFLFPFTSVCRTYDIGTDITMANAYCGLFVFPLLLFALVKTKTDVFVKAFLVFGVICLLAAAGEYTPVRSWLYYLPGFSLFRHAAIFRGFTIMSLLIPAAYGLEWWFDSIKQNRSLVFARNVIIGYMVLLIAVFVTVDISNKGFFAFPAHYTFESFETFNFKQNVLTHILAQCTIHLVLLAVVIAALFTGKGKMAVIVIGAALLLDIVISVQLNVPATVITNIKTAKLDGALKKAGRNFLKETERPMEAFTHMGNYDTDPVWYNLSIFQKLPACDGFNNFELKGMAQLRDSSLFRQIIKRPLCYFTDDSNIPDSLVNYTITGFGMHHVYVEYTSTVASQVVLLQNSFPGWQLSSDSNILAMEKAYGLFLKARVPAGHHILQFEFNPIAPVIFFWITVASFLVVVAAAGWLLIRQ